MAEQLAFNMDCMEAMRQMPDKAFDLAIVDPPYGIGITGKPGGGNKQYIPFGGVKREREREREPASAELNLLDVKIQVGGWGYLPQKLSRLQRHNATGCRVFL